jgi:trans-aconitate methyltransferase
LDLAQIPLDDPRSICDLGSGPGNITRLLAQRWPGAAVTGVELTEWHELKTAQRLTIA